MRVVAISDIHGMLPAADSLPEGDVLVIAGDICPDFGRSIQELSGTGMLKQANWLNSTFREWLEEVESRFDAVIGIAGNHDFVFERKDLVPKGLHWIYLEDSGASAGGFKFWGTPWVPNLPRWAFYGSPTALSCRADAIPDDTDVLISHGPPYGHLDRVAGGSLHVGEDELLDAIKRKQPQAVICGHIHEGHGISDMDGLRSVIYNVSLVNEFYDQIHKATVIDSG